jgi:hypothetical protein
MTFEDDYNDFQNSSGLPDESAELYYKHIDRKLENDKIDIIGCSDREFLSYMIGGLSCSNIPDENKSHILHMIAEKLDISRYDASKLLESLNHNAERYSDKIGIDGKPFDGRGKHE